ncbi:MAG: NAD(P)(+) transhydrogenase (Re/Si-specific) subunit beta [Ktedonobacteraceae bacterium]
MIIATELIYLLAAVMFILGLQFLSSPRSARRGNWIAAAGMVLAVAWTVVVLRDSFTTAGIIICVVGFVIGGVVGVVSARRVKMTAMPQMVAIFNGAGGGAAALVGVSALLKLASQQLEFQTGFPEVIAVIIGGISFAGSVVAFLKLQELITGAPITFPGQHLVNGLLALVILALAAVLLVMNSSIVVIMVMLALVLILGVTFVLPIGGADMPVVISMLNACTGLAVAASGFALNNFALIVAGTLVGASGTVLTRKMSDAMGRSLFNVLFGAFGQVQVSAEGETSVSGHTVRSGSAEDIGTLLAYSRSVIIVPGYGLAVAQGQHALRELADLLERRGVEVKYAIHPVAGRMPGHMNVLLAEANVPYEQLKEMDEINDEFKQTDVALVVGANDVVNPAARNSPGSDIYGMPILNADQARNVVILKRSMRPGFAGIDNELFYDHRTILLFGDAKDSLTKLVAAVKVA